MILKDHSLTGQHLMKEKLRLRINKSLEIILWKIKTLKS